MLAINQHKEVEHLFRHKYGKLVALLVRRFGMQHLDKVEDAVQWAMLQAVEFWPKNDVPKSTSAWLYQVAYRYLLSALKQTQQRNALLKEHLAPEINNAYIDEEAGFSGELNDSMLRMLFCACNEQIPIESQLVFILKSLCGFSVKEIALRLFITEANVYKRFGRAKKHLQRQPLVLDFLLEKDIVSRLPLVHQVLYLVFTEGYLSSHENMAIRQDLCEEAIRLTKLLITSKGGNTPNSYALLALMYFHFARLNARQDAYGALLLLEQQDRSQWHKEYITVAMNYLAESANGDNLSRYHIEASIAAQHCISTSFEQTNWEQIVNSYQLLHRLAPSPLHKLNEAIATAQWQSPEAGLAVLTQAEIPDWLSHSYYWYTVLADLYFRSGEKTKGLEYSELAMACAPSEHIKELLQKRLIP